MGICLVFDETMTFEQFEPSRMRHLTIGAFGGGGTPIQSLVVLHIAKEWSGEVRRRLLLADIYTHLKELLIPLATTAIQTMIALQMSRFEPLDSKANRKRSMLFRLRRR
ncbi:DUF2889 domain-containing protein [Caballeronia temeraria]|uniref:DUF2889 domain-containing protein n=1 Tax=Caballeronia temeraria TaxID=1777137 RepID=UPI000772271E